ncbi:MAG: hypothetical protein LBT69_02155 [Lactobacillales bacterium]|jgi:hypothetical protein|nr:hypothetical protein [Lactobacillales bacterium]
MANRLAHLFKYDKKAVNRFSSVRTKEDALSVVIDYISDYTEEELAKDIEDMQSSVIREGLLDTDKLEDVTGGVANLGEFVNYIFPEVIKASNVNWRES